MLCLHRSVSQLSKELGGGAAAALFFGLLKNELFYPRSWQTTTIEQFIQTVDSYIHWYNEKRIKIFLGSLSFLEYRQSLGLTA